MYPESEELRLAKTFDVEESLRVYSASTLSRLQGTAKS